MMYLLNGLSIMKKPRIEDFDPNAPQTRNEPSLKSTFDDMPTIETPPKKTKVALMPAIQQTSMTASHNASNTASQHAGMRAARQSINPTEKMTYRFHPEGKYAVEDIKTTLERKHGIKASAAEIVEESVLLIYEDLLENPNASKLASRLASNTASQKTS